MIEPIHNLSSAESKEIKIAVGKQCRFFLIYQFLFIVVTLLGFLIVSAPYFLSKEITSIEIDDLIRSTSGGISLIGLLIGSLYVVLSQKKKLIYLLVRKSSFTMTFSSFVLVVVLLFASQSVFSLFFAATESMANMFGYTTVSTMINEPTDICYLIYAALLGPVMEEVIFRGVILNGIIKFGKTFSITISAILFAIFHADVAQGAFAFFCGLILGYVAVEYSLKWAILLHIFNNFVISTVLGGIISQLPSQSQQYVNLLFIALGVIGGVLVLFFQKRDLKNYLKKNKAQRGSYKAALTSAWFLISMALGAGMIVFSFSKL